jgi:hypothetical protein
VTEELGHSLYNGWMSNHKGEYLFRKFYFGDNVQDGSEPKPTDPTTPMTSVFLPSIIPPAVWGAQETVDGESLLLT